MDTEVHEFYGENNALESLESASFLDWLKFSLLPSCLARAVWGYDNIKTLFSSLLYKERLRNLVGRGLHVIGKECIIW